MSYFKKIYLIFYYIFKINYRQLQVIIFKTMLSNRLRLVLNKPKAKSAMTWVSKAGRVK